MFGGDLSKMDDFTLSLITNDEVLSVNQASLNNHKLFRKEGLVAWVADVPNSKDKYVALFNINDKADQNTEGLPIVINFSDLGFTKKCLVRDLWKKENVGTFNKSFSTIINFHGTGVYRITQK